MEVGSAGGSTSNHGNDYLEQFKLLAKTTSGKATAAIIDKVMRHKHIFVFTDLLELECVQQLRDTESHSTLRALEILSHGVYANYLKEKDSLPPFTDVQLNKLRQLTILSLAAKTKVLNYDDLHKALGVTSVRELEDLLIESYNSGLVDGKIDHRNKRFVVDNTSSRDVDSSDLDAMIGKIQAWCTDSDRLLATIDKARLDVQDSRQRIQKAKAAQKEAADRAGNDPNVPHSTPSISVQSKMESSAGPTSMDLA